MTSTQGPDKGCTLMPRAHCPAGLTMALVTNKRWSWMGRHAPRPARAQRPAARRSSRIAGVAKSVGDGCRPRSGREATVLRLRRR